MTMAWNHRKDQMDWLRHNETQRSQFAGIVLAIAAALIAFQKDRPQNLAMPTLVIAAGVLGFVAVLKYWERFMYHTAQEFAFRNLVDTYFKADDRSICQTTEGAEWNHVDWSKKWAWGLFQDSRMVQYVLWAGSSRSLRSSGFFSSRTQSPILPTKIPKLTRLSTLQRQRRRKKKSTYQS